MLRNSFITIINIKLIKFCGCSCEGRNQCGINVTICEEHIFLQARSHPGRTRPSSLVEMVAHLLEGTKGPFAMMHSDSPDAANPSWSTGMPKLTFSGSRLSDVDAQTEAAYFRMGFTTPAVSSL